MTTYSTSEQVRDEAGFKGNINVLESKITTFLNAAHNVVAGIVGQKYVLDEIPSTLVPAILELIERNLAAGYLMKDEYGSQAEGTTKDGQKKIDWAMDQLEMIEKGTIQIYDENNVLLDKQAGAGMAGYPIESDPDSDTGERSFTRDMEF